MEIFLININLKIHHSSLMSATLFSSFLRRRIEISLKKFLLIKLFFFCVFPSKRLIENSSRSFERENRNQVWNQTFSLVASLPRRPSARILEEANDEY